MSDDNRVGGAFVPGEVPEPARLNIDEIERVKKLFEDSTLAKYIIMAGVSGVVIAAVEFLRAVVDLIRFFLQR